MKIATRPVCGVEIFAGSTTRFHDNVIAWLDTTENRSAKSVFFCNAHMLVESRTNTRLRAALDHATMRVADGKPVAVALRIIHRVPVDQICGPDAMIDCCEIAEKSHKSIFLYGSTKETLDSLQSKLLQRFPKLIIKGAISPPFGSQSTALELALVEEIARSGADICFVGLGCPKQEIFIHKYSNALPMILLGVGAAFDFISGNKARAPLLMRKLCLEWFFRLVTEPRRLFVRYFTTNPQFLLFVAKYWTQRRNREKMFRIRER